MKKQVYSLRMESQLKEALRDRAKLENRSQNDLINFLIQSYVCGNSRTEKLPVKLPKKDDSKNWNKLVK